MTPQILSAPSWAFCKGNQSGNVCVVGKVCLTNESVMKLSKKGETTILFKEAISITDFETLFASTAVATSNGNNFSLATSLTHLFCKTAALGCQNLEINAEAGEVKCGEVTINAFGSYLREQLKAVFQDAGAKSIVTIRLFNPDPISYLESPIELAKQIGVLLAQKDLDSDEYSYYIM